MRMSKEEAAKNRTRVVRTASEKFREHGYDGIGIAALMKASGLTNGAFYKQFTSKEDLIAKATASGLAENAAAWEKALEGAEDPLAAFIDWYLSDGHLAHRGKGCTYAALAAEAPRHEQGAQDAFESGLKDGLALLQDRCDTDPAETMRLLSQVVGALMLARAVSTPELAEQILAATREDPALRSRVKGAGQS